MTPTLAGRLQTRLVLTCTVGALWMVLLTPFLPHGLASDMAMSGPSGTIMTRYMTMMSDGTHSTTWQDEQMALYALGLLVGLGLLWECLYHGLQQLRWDRDWPPFFVLVAAVPEGTVLWLVLRGLGVTLGSIDPLRSSVFPMFAALFLSTWVVVLLVELGPMRVVAPRWRYRGMRLWGGGTRTHGGGAGRGAVAPAAVRATVPAAAQAGVGADLAGGPATSDRRTGTVA
jgi:hypothetical protein